MENREITKDEIKKITDKSPKREKAFFTIMRQSGLKPHTIKQLKIGDVERILDASPPTPCRIRVQNEKNPIFIGNEATYYLKEYLEDRKKEGEILTEESLLFTAHNNAKNQIITKNVSRTFRYKAPIGLQLSSLTKFYKNNIGEYSTQLKNYPPRDDESHRDLYARYAMPSLEIDPNTTFLTMHQLRKQQERTDREVESMKETITKIQPLVEFVNSFDDYKNLKTILTFLRDDILAEYPDEKLRPIGTKFSRYIEMKVKDLAKTLNITEEEALKQLFTDNVETMKKAEENWEKIEKRLKLKQKHAKGNRAR